jgi:hypothetical protein
VEKFSTARQSTYDNTIKRMRVTCLIIKATYAHSEYVIIITFLSKNTYVNAPLSYAMHALPTILIYSLFNDAVCSCYELRILGLKIVNT